MRWEKVGEGLECVKGSYKSLNLEIKYQEQTIKYPRTEKVTLSTHSTSILQCWSLPPCKTVGMEVSGLPTIVATVFIKLEQCIKHIARL